MKRLLCLSIFLIMMVLNAKTYAQEDSLAENLKEERVEDVLTDVLGLDEEVAELSTSSDDEGGGLFERHAVGVGFGFPQFLGFQYATTLHPKFQLRVGFGYSSINDYSQAFDLAEGASSSITIKGSLLMPKALVDYHPFGNSIHLTAGLGYAINTEIRGIASSKGEIPLAGTIVINAEDMGIIELGSDFSGIAPYLGLGFGRGVPKNRIGFSVDLGFFYLSEPQAILNATEVFLRTEDELPQLQENLSSFRWLPELSFKLTVKLN